MSDHSPKARRVTAHTAVTGAWLLRGFQYRFNPRCKESKKHKRKLPGNPSERLPAGWPIDRDRLGNS